MRSIRGRLLAPDLRTEEFRQTVAQRRVTCYIFRQVEFISVGEQTHTEAPTVDLHLLILLGTHTHAHRLPVVLTSWPT